VKYHVLLVEAAERDLLDLHWYVELHDSPERADRLLERIEQTIAMLDQLPERGHFPPELARIGIHDYREIHYKPYRIIYEVSGTSVFVHAIVDGRRDLRELLQARMLR
jgi:toxin ParE1/3/4